MWLPTTSSGFLKVIVSAAPLALRAGTKPCTVNPSASTFQDAPVKAASRGAVSARAATLPMSASAKASTVATIRASVDPKAAMS